jgi:transcriptional regulator GlxA family with amidase domain
MAAFEDSRTASSPASTLSGTRTRPVLSESQPTVWLAAGWVRPGFARSSLSHLASAFRRQTGLSPRAFRASIRR